MKSEPTSTEKREILINLGKKLSMQLVALKAKYISIDSVPAEVLVSERAIIKENLILKYQETDKPVPSDEILNKIVLSAVNKFYQDKVLLEQDYVFEDEFNEQGSYKVKEVLNNQKLKLNLDSLSIEEFAIFKPNE